MEKKILIGSLLILIFLIGGCALSDYIQGKVPEDSYSLLDDNDVIADDDSLENDIDDINDIIEDTDKEIIIEDDDLEDTEGIIEASEDDEDIIMDSTSESVDETSFIKLSVKENEKVRLNPKAIDPDQDDIKFTYSEPLDQNGEWQTNYGDAGNYIVTITASDGKLTTSKKVLLIVERVNVPPVIEGVNDEITINEGDVLSLAPKITDPNGDRVTVDISDPVGNDGIWELGYTDRGNYDVTIEASDGEFDTTKKIKIIVQAKNIPPEIEDLPDINIKEGDNVTIEPVVSDLNEDKVTVSISEPIGDDGFWATGYTDHGVYEVVVKALDGIATSSKKFTLTVEDVNKVPEIVDITLEK